MPEAPTIAAGTAEQDARGAALAALATEHGLQMPSTGHQHAASNTEDLEPYLTGEEAIGGPWATVTVGHTEGGEAIAYVAPGYATAELAGAKAVANVTHDIFAEWPVEIVNLDTGERRKPVIGWA